jgi:hypothetical protein
MIIYDYPALALPYGESFRSGYDLGVEILKRQAAGNPFPRGCGHGTIFVKGSEPARLLAAASDQGAFFAGLRKATTPAAIK